MSKIKKVKILSSHELELLEDCSKGDVIDLKNLDQIQLDLGIIEKEIKEGKDAVYQGLLKKEKERLETELTLKLESAHSEKLNKKEQELIKQEAEFSAYKKQVASEKENEVLKIKQTLMAEFNEKLNEKEKELTKEKTDFANYKTQVEEKHALALQVKELELNEQIIQKQIEIDNLKREQSLASVKVIGENLEKWCAEEYQKYAIQGFQNCTWEKDNDVIKWAGEVSGTKADFIFKVFNNEKKEKLMTTVVMDMKSEALVSKTKNKNSDHYKKLDLDRQKKKGDYALLVSELELSSDNDSPIKKVQEYNNMYVVRPQYMMLFLSIITTISEKNKELHEEIAALKLKGEDTTKIFEAFDSFKNETLKIAIDILDKHLSDIETKTRTIQKSTESILKSTETITKIIKDNIIYRLENFNIQNILK